MRDKKSVVVVDLENSSMREVNVETIARNLNEIGGAPFEPL